jgi:hypothetical protein
MSKPSQADLEPKRVAVANTLAKHCQREVLVKVTHKGTSGRSQSGTPLFTVSVPSDTAIADRLRNKARKLAPSCGVTCVCDKYVDRLTLTGPPEVIQGLVGTAVRSAHQASPAPARRLGNSIFVPTQNGFTPATLTPPRLSGEPQAMPA